jgi:hypothetical protein
MGEGTWGGGAGKNFFKKFFWFLRLFLCLCVLAGGGFGGFVDLFDRIMLALDDSDIDERSLKLVEQILAEESGLGS